MTLYDYIEGIEETKREQCYYRIGVDADAARTIEMDRIREEDGGTVYSLGTGRCLIWVGQSDTMVSEYGDDGDDWSTI